MDNILELKTINELCKINFFIPSYQRGYRWGEKEVTDLLDDISDFTPKLIGDDKTWYCLQPLVIKAIEDADGVISQFEVIDGQQRLTTIYLILYFLNQLYTEENREKTFELNYETRKKSHDFLNNLKKNDIQDENIDFHYISKAYKTISDWFNKDDFDRNNFQSKFKFNTKVIWYESREEDPIAIFTRINIGKIPLTNAELIKALFLNSSNFEDHANDKIRLKQLEISTEWDNIEHALQNDMFWYFISGNNELTNRIELIFNLMNDEKDQSDIYSTFRFFNKKFHNKTANTIGENWIEIKNYFQRFQEWFNERELYHKIGFLIYEGEGIDTFIDESANRTKNEFKEFLNETIRGKLRHVILENLQYGDKKIKTILLLYNIQTMLNNDKDNSLFPFDRFKTESWDIEHITSIKDKMPETTIQKQNWLDDADKFIEDQALKQRVTKCDVSENFELIYQDVISYFNVNVEDDDINDISNLTLLDSETNRGYKNAVFPVKRITIIQREKKGTFIPLCTKNAFLKYFSEYPPKMSFWTQEDRDNYFSDIKTVLLDYLPKEQELLDE